AAIDTLDTTIVQRPHYKQNLCLDKGYDFPEIEKEVIKRKYIPHIRHRGEEGFIELRYSAKRWVVERTNSWHNRFRKLLVRYEKKSENYLSLVYLACCIIVYRRTNVGSIRIELLTFTNGLLIRASISAFLIVEFTHVVTAFDARVLIDGVWGVFAEVDDEG